MSEFEEYLKRIESKDKRLLKKKEKTMIKLMNTVFLTIEGKITIPQLIKEFGAPIIIKNYVKIEVRTGSTRKPTIIVERFYGAILKFTDNIVIPGIPQDILLDIPHSGIEIRWVRPDDYKPWDMPKATKAEWNKALADMERKVIQ